MVPPRTLVLASLLSIALLSACAKRRESYRLPPIQFSAGSAVRLDAEGRPELNPQRLLQVGDSLSFWVGQRRRGELRDHPGMASGWRWRLASD